MSRPTMFVIAALLGLAGGAVADTPKPVKGPKLAKMTCREFLALDEVARPKIVYWAEGVNRKGKLAGADAAAAPVPAA